MGQHTDDTIDYPAWPDGVCAVPSCGRPTFRDGICSGHYSRLQTIGHLDEGRRIRERRTKPTLCGVRGCPRDAVTRGWCHRHYDRWRKNGDPMYGETAESIAALEPVFIRRCSVEGCDGKVIAHRLCGGHYRRLRVHGDVMADVPLNRPTTHRDLTPIVKTRGQPPRKPPKPKPAEPDPSRPRRGQRMPDAQAMRIVRSVGLEPTTDYPGSTTKWSVECMVCGTEFEVVLRELQRGRHRKCPHCGHHSLPVALRVEQERQRALEMKAFHEDLQAAALRGLAVLFRSPLDSRFSLEWPRDAG